MVRSWRLRESSECIGQRGSDLVYEQKKWVYTIFRQKNIRTKDAFKGANVHSSELGVHLSLKCLHLRCRESYSTFVERTEEEVGAYISCYGVIPGWDQESSQWVCTVLSQAHVLSFR